MGYVHRGSALLWTAVSGRDNLAAIKSQPTSVHGPANELSVEQLDERVVKGSPPR
jgi:hypothetical protein